MAQITLVIPDKLLTVYQEFQVKNGAGWAAAYLVEKLKELEARLWEEAAKAAYSLTNPKPVQ